MNVDAVTIRGFELRRWRMRQRSDGDLDDSSNGDSCFPWADVERSMSMSRVLKMSVLLIRSDQGCFGMNRV